MKKNFWKFIDNCASFEAKDASKFRSLYLPLCNERLMSSLSPLFCGDIKTSQNNFLLTPVSRIDLTNSKESRNFWVYKDGRAWSVAGVSKNKKQIDEDIFNLEAGLLWQRITRENNEIGLKSEILSFIPATGEPVEIMQVKLTNISSRKITFIPTAAIPIYARGAGSIRDHRHVTSLLQRIKLHKFGVIVKPTLSFDESGHKPNKTNYFVLGWSKNFIAPEYIYPTQEIFCGDEGDLEAPESVLKNLPAQKTDIQGKEAMGALRFESVSLNAGASCSYTLLMGIVDEPGKIKSLINKFNTSSKIEESLKKTHKSWLNISSQISLSTKNHCFDNWLRWVSIQPHLRKIYGCSFLPDFDYGKGGRGWRDLWQDCLGLILSGPASVRDLLINNFSGVRIDGSNATIIGKNQGEFIADRNNISRVWMDHGVWPLITLELYLNETGDYSILFAETSYFKDHQINRSALIDNSWNASMGQQLKTRSGKIYKGTVLEHLLVEALVQFFNVGFHNQVRLEGADWNDGLDMAAEKGESVTFSAMYARNLGRLSELLLSTKKKKISIAKELNMLLVETNYNDIKAKLRTLENYFVKTSLKVSGERVEIDTLTLARDLKEKSEWMMRHIRQKEWLKEGFFNGYYDNNGKRVEGKKNGPLRMCLSSQVFPIMSGVAEEQQISAVIKSVRKYLFDKDVKGLHLNTDFKEEQLGLGRAFSFVYGEKENGAFFNHMIVMYAFALYKRGFIDEAWNVLNSVYDMAVDSGKSKIYPCLPEYFDLKGRGMYSYLTGSASWFMLTLLTEAFGVKGKEGALLIEPKLSKKQFAHSETISITRAFADRRIQVNFSNPKKLGFGQYKIVNASLNSRNLPIQYQAKIIIPRSAVKNLPKNKVNIFKIVLG